MAKVWALYEKMRYPTPDNLIDEYETESEARENLRVLNKYGKPSEFYVREQEETHRPWLENADCFCYGDTVD